MRANMVCVQGIVVAILLLIPTVCNALNELSPVVGPDGTSAGNEEQGNGPDTFSLPEIFQAGHEFFHGMSESLARRLESSFTFLGRPNAYIVGDELGLAVFTGLRYGKGTLITRDEGVFEIFWQGPSIGWDIGIHGSKSMFLVYNLRDLKDLYKKYPGVAGIVSLGGGAGTMFTSRNGVTVIPVQTGIGFRLGVNLGYIQFTPTYQWLPF